MAQGFWQEYQHQPMQGLYNQQQDPLYSLGHQQTKPEDASHYVWEFLCASEWKSYPIADNLKHGPVGEIIQFCIRAHNANGYPQRVSKNPGNGCLPRLIWEIVNGKETWFQEPIELAQVYKSLYAEDTNMATAKAAFEYTIIQHHDSIRDAQGNDVTPDSVILVNSKSVVATEEAHVKRIAIWELAFNQPQAGVNLKNLEVKVRAL